MVGPTMSLTLFPERVGRAAKYGTKRGRHYTSEPGTVEMMGFRSGDHTKSNTNVGGDKNGKGMRMVNAFVESESH